MVNSSAAVTSESVGHAAGFFISVQWRHSSLGTEIASCYEPGSPRPGQSLGSSLGTPAAAVNGAAGLLRPALTYVEEGSHH